MTDYIGNIGQNSPRYLDRTASQTTPSQETAELQSNATAREQRQREQSVQNSEPLQTPTQTPRAEIVQPDAATINQLETSNSSANLDNANGLGRTAVNSYQSLDNAELNQQLSERVRVDVQV